MVTTGGRVVGFWTEVCFLLISRLKASHSFIAFFLIVFFAAIFFTGFLAGFLVVAFFALAFLATFFGGFSFFSFFSSSSTPVKPAPLMSMRQPVSLAARRTFCPSFPIARESWSSGTSTWAVLVSASTLTLSTVAGESAAATNLAGSSL